MYKQLIKLTLISSFGKGSSRPLVKSISLLAIGSIGLLLAGLIVAKPLRYLTLAQNLPHSMIFIMSAVAVFTILGFLLLPITDFVDSGQSLTHRNLLVLPLHRLTRWFVMILPIALIVILITEFFLPILDAIAGDLNAGLGVLVAGYMLGLFAIIGMSVSSSAHSSTVKYLGFICLSSTQIYILDIMVKTSSSITRLMLGVVVACILAVCSLGIAYRYFAQNTNTGSGRAVFSKIQLPSWLVKNLWFGLKLLRNKKSASSFIFSLVVALSLAVFMYLKHSTFLTANILIMFGAILTCSFACEARGISRRYKTPEILTLKGVNYFINSQIRGLVLLNSIILAPVFVTEIGVNQQIDPATILYGLALAFAAMMLGFMFSTLLVPASGEFGAQFFTALLAIASIFLLPKIFKLSALSLYLQAVSWLCIAGACLLAVMLIEDLRRKNHGYA